MDPDAGERDHRIIVGDNGSRRLHLRFELAGSGNFAGVGHGQLGIESCARAFGGIFSMVFSRSQREIPAGEGLIVSPGDGHVTETVTLATPDGPRQRISIFLSVFDVHINRAPIAGVLSSVRYQKGQYLNAMNPASTEKNEQNIATVQGEGIEVTFKQIAGLLARRIVFNPKEGDTVERGQRVGLIKFGSRVDVLLRPMRSSK